MHMLACAFQTIRCHLSCFELNKSTRKTVLTQMACLTLVILIQLAVMHSEVYAQTFPASNTEDNSGIIDKDSYTQKVQQFESALKGKDPTPKDQETFTLLGETWITGPEQSTEALNGQLLVALGNDDVEEVKLLLDSGAGVNTANDQGMTPIMITESAKVAQLLLDNGADPKATDVQGGSVIHYAVSRENAPELIRLFAAKGVDPNLRGWENEPAIIIAVDYFYETKAFAQEQPNDMVTGARQFSPKAVLKALVDVGADINATDNYGNTALMNATVQNSADMVKLLLELGADKSIKKNGNGQAAKEIAYDMGHRQIFQLLE